MLINWNNHDETKRRTRGKHYKNRQPEENKSFILKRDFFAALSYVSGKLVVIGFTSMANLNLTWI